MNDESRAVAEGCGYSLSEYAAREASGKAEAPPPAIPEYLQETYWWAYLHPKALHFFEREWVVNLILWGNMRRLTAAVLDETDLAPGSRLLQVACVYGQFSSRLAAHLESRQSKLDLVDVAPIQLKNVREKLAAHDNVGYHHQDSSALRFPAASFDQTVVFFLLHEQPEEVRRRTVAEALRVTRPGGKVVFVDYHAPRRRNPFRYVMKPVLAWLEPFAMDLWREPLSQFMPPHIKPEQVDTRLYFGGLYQKVVVQL